MIVCVKVPGDGQCKCWAKAAGVPAQLNDPEARSVDSAESASPQGSRPLRGIRPRLGPTAPEAHSVHPRCLWNCLRRVQRVVASHVHSPRLAGWCARSSYVPCPWLQKKLCHKSSSEKGARLIIWIAQTGALCHHSDNILVLDS
jgi:hypothetical protein